MALLRPTPWTQQPQGAVEIDPSSGFKYAWTATGAGTNPYQANTDSPVVSAGGLALRLTSNVQQMLATDSGIGLQGGTFLFHGKSMSLVAYGEFGILDAAASSSSRAGCHLPFTDGTVYFDFGGADTGTTRVNVSGLTFSESDVFILTTGPRGMEIWQNGILRASNSANPTRTASGYPFGLGGNNYSLGGGRDLRCKLFAYSPNQITVQQVKSLSANPWQIFKPLPRRIFAPVATSSDHLIIGTNSSQTNTTSQGAISQSHLVTISTSAQANTAAQAAINQTHLVSVASSNQSNVASDAAISQSAITLVTVTNSNQTNTTSDAGIQQTHLVTVANSYQANQASDAAIKQTHIATASNSAQTNTTSDAAIQPTHLVAVASSNQANVASPASITQTLDKYVSAADSTQANTGNTGSIQQTHLIVSAGVAIDNVASASAVVQEHLLTAANSAQTNTTSGAFIYSGAEAPSKETILLPSHVTLSVNLASQLTQKHELMSPIAKRIDLASRL